MIEDVLYYGINFQVDIEAGEVIDLLEDGAPTSSLPPLRPNRAISRARMLPRTRASERVRARVTRSRQQRAQANTNARREQEREREQQAVIDAIAVSLAGICTVTSNNVRVTFQESLCYSKLCYLIIFPLDIAMIRRVMFLDSREFNLFWSC